MEEESEILDLNLKETPGTYSRIVQKKNVFDNHTFDCEKKTCETTESSADNETKKDTENVILPEDPETEPQLIRKSKSKRIAIIDSDDSDAENKSETDKCFPEKTKENKANENKEDQQTLKNSVVYISNNKGQLIPEDSYVFEEIKNKLNALCDSESSEDDNNEESVAEMTNRLENIKSISKVTKKPIRKAESSSTKEKPKKMTGKEALEQRKEIFNESQKRLRNLNVAIPYHKPKTRSLKEFLSNKPKISSAVPSINTPSSVAIKLASQQLNVITEKIKEHEKVVQVFYKSESESEDDYQEQENCRNENEKEENELETKPSDNNDENKIASSEDKTEEVKNNLGSIESLKSEEGGQENGSANGDKTRDTTEGEENVFEMNKDSSIQKEQLNSSADEVARDTDKNEVIINVSGSKTVEIDKRAEEYLQTNFNEQTNQMEIEENVYSETIEQQDINKPCSRETGTDKEITESSTLENNKDVDVDTFQYDFNLDEVEIDNTENFSNNIKAAEDSRFEEKEERVLRNIIQHFTNAEQSKETTTKPTKLQLLKEKLSSFKQPKLSGNPNEIIVFRHDEPTSNEITKLKGRFLSHSLAKKGHKNEVHTEVVSFDGGELRKETIVMAVDADDEPVAVMEIPGAKLQKLREELQNKIMKDKSEKWQTKFPPLQSKEEQSKEGENCDDEYFEDDEDEEEVLLTDSDLSDEDEEENNDVEKKSKKCDFIDEEAEESNHDETEDEKDNCDENKEGKQPDEKESNEDALQNSTKKLKRIVKAFEDDDSDAEESEKKQDNNSKEFNVELDSTQSYDEDDVLPAYQPRTSETPVRQPSEHKDDFDFLTPVTFLTGLQSYSASKFLRESPSEAFPILSSSQLRDSDTNTSQDEENTSQKPDGPQKKLVFDPVMSFENGSSQADMENIAFLCSGTFSTQLVKDKEIPLSAKNMEDGNKDMDTDSLKSSGDTNGRIVEKVFLDKTDKEMKNLQNSEFENMFISQLLDEEEMENFKKKFESPVNLESKSTLNEDCDVKIKGGRLILDSSDEETGDEVSDENLINKKKKYMKKITFSDDDSDSDEEENNKDEEQIDLHDETDEDDNINSNKKSVNYDSEENEIEEDGNEDDNDRVPLKPSEFFENEAELSESEWGSEDEIENEELDKLEAEEGDKEKFDEVEIRRNLEKIHMRQILDDDNREVKILQELLLEDGELHGSGRRRQFRWKDINLLFGNEITGKENEEGNITNQDETDNEERWRKMRYYRELFLKEKMEKGNVIEENETTLLSSSNHIIELGQKALERSSSASQNNLQTTDLKAPKLNDDNYDEPLSFFNKRGSFLARTDKVLTRMAELTKVPTNPILGAPKNSRNFVFQHVSSSEIISKSETSFSKRKLKPKTPLSLKKIKLSSTLAVTKQLQIN